MSDSYDDPAQEPASAVSANLTEQMLHLTNRFEQERLKLEERTFRGDGELAQDGEGEGEEG
ncbi:MULTISPECIES: hypothetical protein [unclassified Caulobacter]|uniref:hypothetical protein n=1 Tax=unclassified Caulobacter TaxID=2648921 RepID=UPI0004A7712C|nr:hypothetical protein [Caulobacter sp. UNC358MFTsu5.1]